MHTSLMMAASPPAYLFFSGLPTPRLALRMYWAQLFQYFAILPQIVFPLVCLQVSALMTFGDYLYIRLESLPVHGALHPPSVCLPSPLLLSMLTSSYSHLRNVFNPVINLKNSFKMIF